MIHRFLAAFKMKNEDFFQIIYFKRQVECKTLAHLELK